MDDEQGPWWTRPPEPGPQAPLVQRRRTSGQGDVDVEPPVTESGFADAPPAYPATGAPNNGPAPFGLFVPAPPIERDPEPPPTPKPAKPVVRRIAVVPPTPPPVRTIGRDPRDERTESLPPVGDDIFATFSGPLPTAATDSSSVRGGGRPAAGGRDAAGEPLDGAEPDRPTGLLANVKVPDPRVLLLGAAAALVVLLIVVVALVSGRGASSDPVAGPSAGPSAVAGTSALQGRNPDGLRQVSAVDAASQLREAGEGGNGSVVEAWGWNDKNGRNLVVTTVTAAGANKRTLRVTHVAGLDGKPRTLRVMQDPKLPAQCKRGGTAGFTAKSLIVRDLDSNGYAEVISGWSSRCGKDDQSVIRLALITNGDKYILRGEGVIGQTRDFTPAPAAAKWPNGFLKVLSAQYSKLYG